MRQVLGAGALGRPRGIGWRGRWEVGLGWGIHVNPWLIHVNVWQKPLQYCKLITIVISLQLIKINGKNNKIKSYQGEKQRSNWQNKLQNVMQLYEGWNSQAGWARQGSPKYNQAIL